eukprot:XP_028349265.1 peroxisomal acyl-coenzyme A oxidase 1-like [Physeter catodon]
MSTSSLSKVNPDLLVEREKASFKAADFALALYGQRNYALLRKLGTLVFRNPAFDLRYLWAADGGAAQYLSACKLAEEVVKLMRQLKLNEAEEAVALLQILAGEDMFLMLHLTMFLPTLQIMCDDDQVRDLETHKSLPGVQLFHIGKKLGYNSMDNGAVIFKNARIPRRHLLMRFSHVDSNGHYKVQGNKKLMYGTMTFTRKQIIMAAGVHLAKSVVIAIRYSAVRRQFAMNMGKPEDTAQSGGAEVQVLDYSTQQHTLFPLLAAAVAFTVTGLWVDRLYTTFLVRRSCFKKLTQKAFNVGSQDLMMTAFKKVLKRIRPNAVAIADAFWIPDQLLNSALGRSCSQIYGAAKQYAMHIRNGKSAILEIFLDAIESGNLECAAVRSVWRELWLCLALSWCDEFLGEFFAAEAFNVGSQDLMMTAFKKVLKRIRPNAVAIADAFWIPDQLLNSALGRYDGRVYEALMESTKLEALNRVDVAPGYYEHLQYILHPERRSQQAKL